MLDTNIVTVFLRVGTVSQKLEDMPFVKKDVHL